VSAAYRIQQFIRAVGAWIWPVDLQEFLESHALSPTAEQLFRAMPRYDQQHALRVCCALKKMGHAQPDLLAAALLHDVGKTVHPSGGLRLWHRVAAVLMRAFWPGQLERFGRDQPGSWRWPFYVAQHHAALGAELARQAGCSPGTVELIRRHEDPPDPSSDPSLAALQAADSVS
jgi:putative nucleotidyltransferase with HDIG domain